MPTSERSPRPALRTAAATALLLALAAPAAAQEGPVRTVSYGEAVELALRRNTELLRAGSEARRREARVTRERMDFLPEVRVSTDARRRFGRSFSQEEGAILSETSDVLGADVSASVDLFRGFEHTASLRRADRDADAGELRLARAREEVLFRVVEGLTAVELAARLETVRAEERDAQQELLEQVERLVEVGRRPVSDLYLQQAARAEAEAALVEARRQVGLAETEMIGLLQLDPRGRYRFGAPPLPDTAGAGPPTLDALLDTALARRADLRAAAAEVDAARQGVRVARSGYWPTVSLSVAYGSSWSSQALQPVPGTGAEPQVVQVMPLDGAAPVSLPVPGTGEQPDFRRPSFADQFDGRRGGSVGLSVRIPLFDRLQARTEVAEARLEAEDARLALQDRRQQVALEVRQALLDWQAARAQLAAAEARLEAATLARQAARRRYELGAATFVELSQANAQHVAAASAQVQARYRVSLTRQRLAYHTGAPAAQDPPATRTGGSAP